MRTDGLETFPYSTDRLAVVMRDDHPLAGVESPQFADVLDDDFVALESGSSMMRLLAEQAVIGGKTLKLRVQVRSFEAVCRMVQAGLGTGLLPYQAAIALGEGKGLVVRPFSDEWAVRRMLVCVLKGRTATTSLAKLVSHLTSRPRAEV